MAPQSPQTHGVALAGAILVGGLSWVATSGRRADEQPMADPGVTAAELSRGLAELRANKALSRGGCRALARRGGFAERVE